MADRSQNRTKNSPRSPKRSMSSPAPVQVSSQPNRYVARSAEGGLALLIGAGVGVLAMYLLDADSGEKRRGRIASSATDAMSSAAESAWDSIRSAGQSAGGRMSHFVQPAMDAVSDTAASARKSSGSFFGSILDSVADTRDKLQRRVAAAKREAANKAEFVRHRAQVALGNERDHHYVGQSACAIGSLLIGAAAVYLLDPTSGEDRRAKVFSFSEQTVHGTAELFNRVGHFVGQRLHLLNADQNSSEQDGMRPSETFSGGSSSPDSSAKTEKSSVDSAATDAAPAIESPS